MRERKAMAVDCLFLVRHGETKANERGTEAGPLDYPLTSKGVKEASFIAKTLSKLKFSAVYSSPVYRALETARILARPHRLKVKTLKELTDARLKPKYVGKEVRHHILTTPRAYLETNDDLLERTGRTIKIISNVAEGNVMVVSHA